MKPIFINSCLLALAATCLVGCGPKPVADERPATDATVTTDTPETTASSQDATPDSKGVEVQVGGGQGVQVDVDRKQD